jgi:hypothetical protein
VQSLLFAEVSPSPAQVRVMPRCWYVLVRFWLRVDRVMVRLREVSGHPGPVLLIVTFSMH